MAASCVVCLDQVATSISCANGHSMCSLCLGEYVDGICETAATTEIPSLSADEKKIFGHVTCPCAGAAGDCDAQPFRATSVVSALAGNDACLERFLNMTTLLPIADATAKVFEEANSTLQDELAKLRLGNNIGEPAQADAGELLLSKQIKRLMPNARQCKMCHWGPMSFLACSDLNAHHGQVVARIQQENEEDEDALPPLEVKIDNSCPRCGWFSRERKAWPKWDGTIHKDILPNQWEANSRAAREWYPKVAAAEKKAEAAMAAAAEAEERRKAMEAALDRERLAREAAQKECLEVRWSISSSERACAEASRRTIAQLERERALRKCVEADLAEARRANRPDEWSRTSSPSSVVTAVEQPPIFARAFNVNKADGLKLPSIRRTVQPLGRVKAMVV